VASGAAYLTRPVADRYDAYRFDLVAIAYAAGPTDVVIIDDYSATVIRFLDARQPPSVIVPGSPVPQPVRFQRVLALSPGDLTSALGAEIEPRISVVANRPDG